VLRRCVKQPAISALPTCPDTLFRAHASPCSPPCSPCRPCLPSAALSCRAATFGYWTEAKAEAEGFKKLVPKKCKVLRDGSVLILDAVELVPGGCCHVLGVGAGLGLRAWVLATQGGRGG
jgi:hypothetical protein